MVYKKMKKIVRKKLGFENILIEAKKIYESNKIKYGLEEVLDEDLGNLAFFFVKQICKLKLLILSVIEIEKAVENKKSTSFGFLMCEEPGTYNKVLASEFR